MKVALLPRGTKSLLEVSKEATYEEGLEIAEKLLWIVDHVGWGNPVGMAAPQIGINKRVFIALGKLFINPVVTTFNLGGTYTTSEGCYSIPRTPYKVRRYNQVRVTYTDVEGRRLTQDFDGFEAEVIQHEYDHLQGVLIDQRNKELLPKANPTDVIVKGL